MGNENEKSLLKAVKNKFFAEARKHGFVRKGVNAVIEGDGKWAVVTTRAQASTGRCAFHFDMDFVDVAYHRDVRGSPFDLEYRSGVGVATQLSGGVPKELRTRIDSSLNWQLRTSFWPISDSSNLNNVFKEIELVFGHAVSPIANAMLVDKTCIEHFLERWSNGSGALSFTEALYAMYLLYKNGKFDKYEKMKKWLLKKNEKYDDVKNTVLRHIENTERLFDHRDAD